MPHSTESLPETSHQANPRIQSGPTLAHVTEQPGLPVKFDSKRGCDQIRARLYHDPRITGLELAVALALSEFVRLPACVAYPKQKLLARMVHTKQPKISGALSRLETKGVIEIDRGRTHCRYVFLETWRGHFQIVEEKTKGVYLDIPSGNISKAKVPHITPTQSTFSLGEGQLEPYVLEPVRSSKAAADVLRPVPDRADDDQQQQRRIDGQIASCEMSARALDQDFDAAEHRERIRTGDLTIERMQEFTDGLRIARDERGRRVRR